MGSSSLLHRQIFKVTLVIVSACVLRIHCTDTKQQGIVSQNSCNLLPLHTTSSKQQGALLSSIPSITTQTGQNPVAYTTNLKPALNINNNLKPLVEGSVKNGYSTKGVCPNVKETENSASMTKTTIPQSGTQTFLTLEEINGKCKNILSSSPVRYNKIGGKALSNNLQFRPINKKLEHVSEDGPSIITQCGSVPNIYSVSHGTDSLTSSRPDIMQNTWPVNVKQVMQPVSINLSLPLNTVSIAQNAFDTGCKYNTLPTDELLSSLNNVALNSVNSGFINFNTIQEVNNAQINNDALTTTNNVVNTQQTISTEEDSDSNIENLDISSELQNALTTVTTEATAVTETQRSIQNAEVINKNTINGTTDNYAQHLPLQILPNPTIVIGPNSSPFPSLSPTAPSVPFEGFPPIRPIVIKGSSSKFEKLLPIILIALLRSDEKSGCGSNCPYNSCNCRNKIHYPFPIPVPVNNQVDCCVSNRKKSRRKGKHSCDD